MDLFFTGLDILESQKDFKYENANSYNLLKYSEVCKKFKAIWAENFVIYSPCISCVYHGGEAPSMTLNTLSYFSKMLQSTGNICSMKSCLVFSESIIKHYWMLCILSVSSIFEFQFTATLWNWGHIDTILSFSMQCYYWNFS